MNIMTKVFLLTFATSLASCAATGPANDGFELSQESVNIGTLLGDDTLKVSVDTPIDKQKATSTPQ